MYVSNYNVDTINNAFKNQKTLIHEMNDDYSITTRFVSLDASIQLLVGKIMIFTENVVDSNYTNI